MTKSVEGMEKEWDLEGLPARIFQHEYDHMIGRNMFHLKNCQGEIEVLEEFRDTQQGLIIQELI